MTTVHAPLTIAATIQKLPFQTSLWGFFSRAARIQKYFFNGVLDLKKAFEKVL